VTPEQYIERYLAGRVVSNVTRCALVNHVRMELGETASFSDSDVNVVWMELLISTDINARKSKESQSSSEVKIPCTPPETAAFIATTFGNCKDCFSPLVMVRVRDLSNLRHTLAAVCTGCDMVKP
jgi:hypothetical protein